MPEDNTACRDFERGVCKRGDKCRYYHPEGAAPAEGSKLPICKDFQNKGCSRYKCKFLHITVEEEADYNSTGNLPEHGGHPEKTANASLADKDVCRDFLNGRCDRGSRCKYSHDQEGDPYGAGMSDMAMYGKRPRNEDFYGSVGHNDAGVMEENAMLRQKVGDLEQEIVKLRQMNDTLYEQNAKYRTQLTKSVVYPQINQSVYPSVAAALPTSPAAGVNAYSYLQY